MSVFIQHMVWQFVWIGFALFMYLDTFAHFVTLIETVKMGLSITMSVHVRPFGCEVINRGKKFNISLFSQSPCDQIFSKLA